MKEFEFNEETAAKIELSVAMGPNGPILVDDRGRILANIRRVTVDRPARGDLTACVVIACKALVAVPCE